MKKKITLLLFFTHLSFAQFKDTQQSSKKQATNPLPKSSIEKPTKLTTPKFNIDKYWSEIYEQAKNNVDAGNYKEAYSLYKKIYNERESLPSLQKTMFNLTRKLGFKHWYFEIADSGEMALLDVNLSNKEISEICNSIAWAHCYGYMSNKEKGLKYVNRALEIAPNNPAIQDTKATLLFQLGRYNEAIDIFETALKLDPSMVNSYYYLAKSLDEKYTGVSFRTKLLYKIVISKYDANDQDQLFEFKDIYKTNGSESISNELLLEYLDQKRNYEEIKMLYSAFFDYRAVKPNGESIRSGEVLKIPFGSFDLEFTINSNNEVNYIHFKVNDNLAADKKETVIKSLKRDLNNSRFYVGSATDHKCVNLKL